MLPFSQHLTTGKTSLVAIKFFFQHLHQKFGATELFKAWGPLGCIETWGLLGHIWSLEKKRKNWGSTNAT
jgi:hypothetical protein